MSSLVNLFKNIAKTARTGLGSIKHAVPPASVANPSAQQALKNALIDKRLPYDHLDDIALPAVTSPQTGDLLASYATSPFWGRFPRDTIVLGHVRPDLSIDYDIPAVGNSNVRLPKPIPTSQLVASKPYPQTTYHDDLVLRPHKNTALGRWYAKNLPSDGIVPPVSQPSISAQDRSELISYLDAADRTERIHDAVSNGNINSIPASEIVSYANALGSTGPTYPDDTLGLYVSLLNHRDAAAKLKGMYGYPPRNYPSEDEFEQALGNMRPYLGLPF